AELDRLDGGGEPVRDGEVLLAAAREVGLGAVRADDGGLLQDLGPAGARRDVERGERLVDDGGLGGRRRLGEKVVGELVRDGAAANLRGPANAERVALGAVVEDEEE